MIASRTLRSLLLISGLVLAPCLLAAQIDAEALDRGADLAYRKALEPVLASRRLNADTATTARIRRVANRLLPGASSIDPAARSFHWTVNVVPEATPDVLVYPGGRMLVHEGLVKQTGFADDEIAAVLAFALAPSLLGQEKNRLADAVGSKASAPDPNQVAIAVAEAIGKNPRASRYTAAEIQTADRASVEMLARSAYDPRAAASAWRRLANLRSGIVQIAPVTEERLADIDAAVRAATPLYDEARARAAANAPATMPGRGPTRSGPPMR